jgi:hypothetical protein
MRLLHGSHYPLQFVGGYRTEFVLTWTELCVWKFCVLFLLGFLAKKLICRRRIGVRRMEHLTDSLCFTMAVKKHVRTAPCACTVTCVMYSYSLAPECAHKEQHSTEPGHCIIVFRLAILPPSYWTGLSAQYLDIVTHTETGSQHAKTNKLLGF